MPLASPNHHALLHTRRGWQYPEALMGGSGQPSPQKTGRLISNSLTQIIFGNLDLR